MSSKVTIELRPATAQDCSAGKQINQSLIFWLKSQLTGEFDGPYTVFAKMGNTCELEFKEQFRAWYNADMVYVRKTVWDPKPKQE